MPSESLLATKPPTEEAQAEEICSLFAAAWKSGSRPRIEDYLPTEAAGDFLRLLLHKLVWLDISCRKQNGDAPRVLDYTGRFPSLILEGLEKALQGESLMETRGSESPTPAPLAETLEPREEPSPTRSGNVGTIEGRFLLLDVLGKGAFGTVWKAHDLRLDRHVALKIPREDKSFSSAALDEFIQEAKAAAWLWHRNIVSVLDVTELKGRPAIVMELVQGGTLRSLLQTRELSFGESAALVAEVAVALGYAHELGIVHRDVKPANIMIERGQRAGESAGDASRNPLKDIGRPLVADFGLARRVSSAPSDSRLGPQIGTPLYMSPEQAAGKGHEADGRSDIYSLGVILYELICGKLPFEGKDASGIMVSVIHDEPKKPSQVRNNIPPNLEAVCLKAMAKNPEARYQAAKELEEDLRRWLRGEPVRARPAGKLERLRLWAKRNPRVAGLTAAVILLLFAVATVSTTMAAVLQRRNVEANLQRERAERHSASARNSMKLLREAALARLDDVPMMEDWQKTLMEEVRRYYIALAEAGETDPRDRLEQAISLRDLGQINDKRGNPAESEECYLLAIKLLEQLRKEEPEQSRHLLELSLAQTFLAELLLDNASRANAVEASLDQALVAGRAMRSQFGNSAKTAHALARAHVARGRFWEKSKEHAEKAGGEYTSAVQELREWADLASAEVLLSKDYAIALGNRAVWHGDAGRRKDAKQDYSDAIRFLEGKSSNSPKVRVLRASLGNFYMNFSNFLGKEEAALRRSYAEKAESHCGKLSSEFQGVPAYKQLHVRSLVSLAFILGNVPDIKGSDSKLEQAQAIVQGLLEAYENHPPYWRTIAEVLYARAWNRLREADMRHRGVVAALSGFGPAMLLLPPESLRGRYVEAQALFEKSVDAAFQGYDVVSRETDSGLQGTLHECRYMWAFSYLRLAEHANVFLIAADIYGTSPSTDKYLVSAALLAKCILAVDSDLNLTPVKRHDLADKYALTACERLEKGLLLGKLTPEAVKEDLRLAPLRKFPGWDRLVVPALMMMP